MCWHSWWEVSRQPLSLCWRISSLKRWFRINLYPFSDEEIIDCGLQVIATVSDGMSANRKVYCLHEHLSGVQDENIHRQRMYNCLQEISFITALTFGSHFPKQRYFSRTVEQQNVKIWEVYYPSIDHGSTDCVGLRSRDGTKLRTINILAPDPSFLSFSSRVYEYAYL